MDIFRRITSRTRISCLKCGFSLKKYQIKCKECGNYLPDNTIIKIKSNLRKREKEYLLINTINIFIITSVGILLIIFFVRTRPYLIPILIISWIIFALSFIIFLYNLKKKDDELKIINRRLISLSLILNSILGYGIIVTVSVFGILVIIGIFLFIFHPEICIG